MKRTLLIVIACAVTAGPAFAGLYTQVGAGSADEADLWEVLNVVTNGAIDVDQAQLNLGAGNRVFDQATLPGEVFDQFWRDGTVDVTATALWWGGEAGEGDWPVVQRFMYDNDIDGSSRTDIGPAEWESGSTGTFSVGSGDPFIVGVRNSDTSVNAWSRQSLNSPNARDRMVTFDVSGMDIYAWKSGDKVDPILEQIRFSSDPGRAYLLGIDTGSDTDYQDFIALIEGPCPVPVPGAVLLGMLGLGVAGLKLRKRA